jgi:hypothetical protein
VPADTRGLVASLDASWSERIPRRGFRRQAEHG